MRATQAIFVPLTVVLSERFFVRKLKRRLFPHRLQHLTPNCTTTFGSAQVPQDTNTGLQKKSQAGPLTKFGHAEGHNGNGVVLEGRVELLGREIL